jgi:hypothetical protein
LSLRRWRRAFLSRGRGCAVPSRIGLRTSG